MAPRIIALHSAKDTMGKHCVGFTGTASELSDKDKIKILTVLIGVLRKYGDISTIYVVGGAVGVDTFIAHELHNAGAWVHVVLPPDHDKVDPEWRDYCRSYWQVKSDDPSRSRRYMLRNDVLVASSHVMGAAFPRAMGRSGTQATITRFGAAGKTKITGENIYVLG